MCLPKFIDPKELARRSGKSVNVCRSVIRDAKASLSPPLGRNDEITWPELKPFVKFRVVGLE